jgi:hypothetical protein
MTAAAYGVLLAFVAQTYRSEGHAWGAAMLAVVAFWHWLALAEAPRPLQVSWWSALALATAAVSILARWRRVGAITVWFRPLTLGSVALGLLAVGVAATVPTGMLLAAQAMATVSLGLVLVAHACNSRLRYLLYVGLLAVAGGYVLELTARRVDQTQAYVLPVGLTFLVIAYLESRRHGEVTVKHLAEDFALALMLGGSLLQGLGYLTAGYDRYVYDGYLLLESAAVFGLGVLLRWRRPFFIGALVLVVDVGILLSDPIRALNTWYLVAALGLVMILGVILVERRRQQIPLWLESWRVRLERWD